MTNASLFTVTLFDRINTKRVVYTMSACASPKVRTAADAVNAVLAFAERRGINVLECGHRVSSI